MTMTDRNDAFLEGLFETARNVDAPVSSDLLARVLQDAERPPSVWQAFLQVIGGWPTMGGLVAAGVAGLWIGVAPPTGLATLTAELIGEAVEVDLWSETTFGTEDWIDG